jgi:hypothetical protein
MGVLLQLVEHKGGPGGLYALRKATDNSPLGHVFEGRG